MLNIEIHEEQKRGHTCYTHSVVVEHPISSGQALDFQQSLHYGDDIIIAYACIEPGDDLNETNIPAEYYQFSFLAKRDLTEWLNALAADLFR